MGIILWYPIPFTWLPIRLARGLGNITAKYRWFSTLYLFLCFLVLPVTVFGLSLAGWYVLVGVGVPIIVLVIFVIVTNVMQSKCPRYLPNTLRTWDFLPRPLHSMAPWDKVVSSSMLFCSRHCCCCCRCSNCCNKRDVEENITGSNKENLEVYDNPAMSKERLRRC